MRLRTGLLALLAAGATLVPIAASADTVAAPPNGDSLAANGEFAGAGSGNTFHEVFTCYATASLDAINVTITSCVLTGFGTTNSAPAVTGVDAAATAGTATWDFNVPGPPQLCWTATATFLDQTTKTVSGCIP